MKPVETSLPQDVDLTSSEAIDAREPVRPLAAADQKRLRSIFDAHYDFVWRLLRRLGLDGATAEDGAQQVFMVAARRLSDIEAGRERAFVAGTAVRVAARLRIQRGRASGSELDGEESSDTPSPEDLVDQKKRRELLDAVLGEMEEELRTVLVLAEMEGYGKRELAEMLTIPEGTAASRLRRAREDFRERLSRRLARRRST